MLCKEISLLRLCVCVCVRVRACVRVCVSNVYIRRNTNLKKTCSKNIAYFFCVCVNSLFQKKHKFVANVFKKYSVLRLCVCVCVCQQFTSEETQICSKCVQKIIFTKFNVCVGNRRLLTFHKSDDVMTIIWNMRSIYI